MNSRSRVPTWSEATLGAARRLQKATVEPSPEQALKAIEVMPSIIASLGETLHNLAEVQAKRSGDPMWALGRETSLADPYELEWELHRAGTILAEAAGSVGVAQGRSRPSPDLPMTVVPTPEPPSRQSL